jgi:hypothetical protein
MHPPTSLPFPAPGHAASGSQADEAPPSSDLVTITRVFNSLEAEMLRGCLEAEGIPATLGDVQTIQTDTLLTVALGGIRVMVPETFADAARQTVEAFERGELAIDELPSDAEPAAAEPDEPESAVGFGLSRLTWVVLAIVAVAVVVF